MKILIAPNAFKHSLTATEASLAIKKGFLASGLNALYECFPIADGGDGTGDLIIQKCDGKTVKAQVSDPLGRKIESGFGLIDDGKTAIIEMAGASGIRLLKNEELNPLQTSSYGTGQLIKEALNLGVSKIVLGMGGSATVDGGTGILRALGVRFLSAEGTELTRLPQNLDLVSAIDLSDLDQRILECELVVLCDVDNKLLGNDGAAAVFGPQKGADPQQVTKLEAALQHFAALTIKQNGFDMAQLPHGGTAGGAAAGLAAFMGAKLVNGAAYFLELTQFENALKTCDFLITGEGSLDAQTLNGKGPVGVAKLAKKHQIPVFALTGSVALQDRHQLKAFFDVVLPIGNQPANLTDALKLSNENLSRTAAELGYLINAVALKQSSFI